MPLTYEQLIERAEKLAVEAADAIESGEAAAWPKAVASAAFSQLAIAKANPPKDR